MWRLPGQAIGSKKHPQVRQCVLIGPLLLSASLMLSSCTHTEENPHPSSVADTKSTSGKASSEHGVTSESTPGKGTQEPALLRKGAGLLALDPQVEAEEVKEMPMAAALHLTGSVVPEFGKETDVSTRVSGRVMQVFVKPGDSVKQGDLLSVIDSREISDLQAELLEAKSKLEIAKAREERERQIYGDQIARPKALNEARAHYKKMKVLKELSEGEYKRQLDLFHEKIAAAKDYLAAKAKLEEARVEFDQAFSELQRQETFYKNRTLMTKDLDVAQAETKRELQHMNTLLQRLSFLGMDKNMEKELLASGKISGEIKLMAPVSGSVSHMDVAVGEMVGPDKSLMKLTDLSTMIVNIDVPEADLGHVHVGSKVKIRFTSYPDKEFDSTVTYMGQHVHAESGTIPARAGLPPNTNGLFKLNMAADVDVSEPSKEVLACPKTAIHDYEGGKIVFVKTEHGFEIRKVTLGVAAVHNVEIVSGLKPGELVATEGSVKLKMELSYRH